MKPIEINCTVVPMMQLRQLCIKNNWFTRGTNEQYDKLFYANAAGWPLEEITTIIWLCTDCAEGGRLEIKRVLKQDRKDYLKSIRGDRL